VLWRRGFIEGVVCAGVNLVPALTVLRRHPLRELRLTSNPPPSAWRQLDPNWTETRNIVFALPLLEADELLLATARNVFPHLLVASFSDLSPANEVAPFSLVQPDFQHLQRNIQQLTHYLQVHAPEEN
jgi:hypothetical protein